MFYDLVSVEKYFTERKDEIEDKPEVNHLDIRGHR